MRTFASTGKPPPCSHSAITPTCCADSSPRSSTERNSRRRAHGCIGLEHTIHHHAVKTKFQWRLAQPFAFGLGAMLQAIRQHLLPGHEEARMLERQHQFLSRFAERDVARFPVEIVELPVMIEVQHLRCGHRDDERCWR